MTAKKFLFIDISTIQKTDRNLWYKGIPLHCRLSKIAGAKLKSNNPNIADLNDPNRPTKLAEMFSELYDNEWTDAFEALDNKPDEDRIAMLLQILEVSYNNHVKRGQTL